MEYFIFAVVRFIIESTKRRCLVYLLEMDGLSEMARRRGRECGDSSLYGQLAVARAPIFPVRCGMREHHAPWVATTVKQGKLVALCLEA